MRLFEPITIRGMVLKNRIVMPSMDVGVGYRGQRARAFYGERARGGVGTIIPAGLSVDLLVTDDAWGKAGAVASFVEGLSLLTDEIHKAGAKLGLQLFYAPRFPSNSASPDDTRGDLVGPSGRIESDPSQHSYAKASTKVRELTVGEIEEITSRFGKAAAAAKQAGFDFVEIHGAHGYLLSQFFSPLDNRRSDKYGGDLTKRMRFSLDCVSEVRRAVGDGYPVFFRIGAIEDRPGGISLSDSIEFAVKLEQASADVIDVSIANPVLEHSSWRNVIVPTPESPMGTFANLAASIKSWVRVPVIAVGRNNTRDIAESILSQGKADLVAIGRQLIADPYWADKVMKDQPDEIVPCLSCNTCLQTSRYKGKFRCTVNASVGREMENRPSPAARPKKVLVVGGGPAGMEAAMVASARGHDVTLCEKHAELGGELIAGALPPHKEPLREFKRYLARQVEKSGARVKLNSEVTAEAIAEIRPDAVVIAAGASPVVPKIPGVGGDNVATALDALGGKVKPGNTVIIVGGGMVGCETAEFLAQKGKKVIVLEMLDEIGCDIEPVTRFGMLERLSHAGVRMRAKTRVKEITGKGVRATTGDESEFFEADTVILACGMESNSQLVKELEGKVAELHVIGDCARPAKIADAISDGTRVGLEI